MSAVAKNVQEGGLGPGFAEYFACFLDPLSMVASVPM
jgi:hypothetical protein